MFPLKTYEKHDKTSLFQGISSYFHVFSLKKQMRNGPGMEAFTGRDAKIWLSPAPGAARRLKWTWELIEHEGVLCGTNTQRRWV